MINTDTQRKNNSKNISFPELKYITFPTTQTLHPFFDRIQFIDSYNINPCAKSAQEIKQTDFRNTSLYTISLNGAEMLLNYLTKIIQIKDKQLQRAFCIDCSDNTKIQTILLKGIEPIDKNTLEMFIINDINKNKKRPFISTIRGKYFLDDNIPIGYHINYFSGTNPL